MEAVALKETPLIFHDNKLTISLDKLNNELLDYKIRVDALGDIYIDKESSSINKGSVLKIHAVYINPDDAFDEKLFFEGYKELEDKFEALPEVYSAEFDPADLILTIVLNKQGVKLNATFESGGAAGDPTISEMVEKQLSENAKEVFELVGVSPPVDDTDAIAKLAMVRTKAIEHYTKLRPQPMYVFYGGVKMDISPGAGMNVYALQKELTQRLYEVIGSKLTQPDPAMQSMYANNKAILAIDMLRGMASANTEPVFHVSDALGDDVVERVQEKML